jgi:hypothetical protein
MPWTRPRAGARQCCGAFFTVPSYDTGCCTPDVVKVFTVHRTLELNWSARTPN